MYDKIRNYIDTLFSGIAETEKTIELKEKIYADTFKKFDSLISDGMEPDEAFTNAVNSIGDIHSMLPRSDNNYQANVVISLSESKETALSCDDEHERKIKFVKSLNGSISTTLWMVTVCAYMIISLTTGLWHVTWLLFVLAGLAQAVISQFFRFYLGKKNPIGLIISILIILGVTGVVKEAIKNAPSISDINAGGIQVMSFSEAKLVNTQSISLKGIDSIEISYASEDITVLESDTDEIVVKEYMSINPSKNNWLL